MLIFHLNAIITSLKTVLSESVLGLHSVFKPKRLHSKNVS